MENNGFRNLKVFKESYTLAMEIFNDSKKFPREEVYSLTDQVRRSSRAVSAIIAEGYRKRKYPKKFALMMTDADGEVSETTVHLDFALDCGYISKEKHQNYRSKYEEIGRMLGGMADNPEKFLPKSKTFIVFFAINYFSISYTNRIIVK
jgi:four helix bundle protein